MALSKNTILDRRQLIIGGVCLAILFLVHLLYIGYIVPVADLSVDQARAAGEAAPRTLFVVLKDLEQEVCIILALCCLVLMGEKCYGIYSQRYLFEVDLLETQTPQNDPEPVDQTTPKKLEPPSLATLEALQIDIQQAPLVKTMMASIRRFEATNDVQNAADVIDSNIETTGMKLEAENSMIRYIIWSIPSIGFVGTVRGIGTALSEADEALAGNIASMTESLGIAFNSTLVALLLSIGLTLVLHLLQGLQDGLVIDIEEYCDKYLIKRLAAGSQNV